MCYHSSLKAARALCKYVPSGMAYLMTRHPYLISPLSYFSASEIKIRNFVSALVRPWRAAKV
ncbi:hypothetical protein E2C01_008485 [Portunus trituberculatus]|uniref:Uncharacterized protein n=1 Tax=Portunus trituberculatus TaxID=210409 RepID=A0A5B7D2Z4_PORTR|nr:hypothetical protein [Portunus trituberculatus]